MRPDKQDQARNLAALEAAIAGELTTSRTMTLAVSSAPDSNALTPTVEAWLHDWREYHAGQPHGQILKACLPVAIDQVSPQRIAAAVWHLTQQEWDAGTRTNPDEPATPHTTAHTPAMQAAPASHARIRASQPAGKYAPVTVEIDGERVTVPACVGEVLWDIATGVRRLKFRPETMRKLRQFTPWLAAELRRDHGAKVLSNKHTYDVPAEVARLVDGTKPGTRASTA